MKHINQGKLRYKLRHSSVKKGASWAQSCT